MKSLSTDTHAHDHATDQKLYELLTKEAETVPLEDNDKSTVGVNPDAYPDPEDRSSGSIDAPWGEKPDNNAIQYSNEALNRFRLGREELLGKLFDGKASSDGAEQKLLSSHLDHHASGQFESSSPQLKGKLEKTSSAPQTLFERVRAITGRH